MANQTTPRWRLGIPEAVSDTLLAALRALERVLSRLHGRVEYPAPSVGPALVACTVNTTINSGTYTDITGATLDIAPEVDGTIVVRTHFSVNCATFGAVTDFIVGTIKVNGTAQNPLAVQGFAGAGQPAMFDHEYLIAASKGVTYTVKMVANQTGGSTYTVVSGRTGYVWEFFPAVYRYPQ